VELLIEPCDPCQSAMSAYTVNDIIVSDFVTPEYYTPASRSGARCSYSGRITHGQELLPGGSLSWMDPVSAIWSHREMDEKGASHDLELGAIDPRTRAHRSLREVINTATQHHRRISRSAAPELVDGLRDLHQHVRHASSSRSRALRGQVKS